MGEHLLGGFGPKVARLRLVDHLELRIDVYLEGVLAQDARGHRARWCTPRHHPPSAIPPQAPPRAEERGMRSRSSAAAFTVKVMASTSSMDCRPPGASSPGEQPVGDAPRQGEGLSRAGAGGDHEGAVEGGDGKALALFAGIEIHAEPPGAIVGGTVFASFRCGRLTGMAPSKAPPTDRPPRPPMASR